VSGLVEFKKEFKGEFWLEVLILPGYNDDPENCDQYGRMYDWETALSVCPDGWHLPDDDEWVILEGRADSMYSYQFYIWSLTGWRGYDAGKNLKSREGWSVPNAGTNLTDFSAIPGGYRINGGGYGGIGNSTGFWTSSHDNPDEAWIRLLYHINNKTGRMEMEKTMGYSVRCLKD